jgi:hypothetical protein
MTGYVVLAKNIGYMDRKQNNSKGTEGFFFLWDVNLTAHLYVIPV